LEIIRYVDRNSILGRKYLLVLILINIEFILPNTSPEFLKIENRFPVSSFYNLNNISY
jgi:hypothetical protein